MINLYENRDGNLTRVASVSFSEVLEMGVRCFFQVQEILDRQIVYAEEDDNGTQPQ